MQIQKTYPLTGYVFLLCNWLYPTGRNCLFGDTRGQLRRFGIKNHFQFLCFGQRLYMYMHNLNLLITSKKCDFVLMGKDKVACLVRICA